MTRQKDTQPSLASRDERSLRLLKPSCRSCTPTETSTSQSGSPAILLPPRPHTPISDCPQPLPWQLNHPSATSPQARHWPPYPSFKTTVPQSLKNWTKQKQSWMILTINRFLVSALMSCVISRNFATGSLTCFVAMLRLSKPTRFKTRHLMVTMSSACLLAALPPQCGKRRVPLRVYWANWQSSTLTFAL